MCFYLSSSNGVGAGLTLSTRRSIEVRREVSGRGIMSLLM